ncbi:MAG: helix-turn-helix domain-containing protein [Bacteroidota bacterium]
MIKKFAHILEHKIPDDLKCFVVAFILGESKEKVSLSIPMYATGFPVLINISGDLPTFFINGEIYEYKSRLVLAGQIYRANISFKINGVFEQIGVILHPTTPYYLFHKPGIHLINKWTRLVDVNNENVKELEDSLSKCKSDVEQIELILGYLTGLLPKRLPEIPWLDQSLIRIFEKNGKIDQSDLITRSGVSERHFRRIFKKVIGVSPKYFCKVIQLNTVFDLLNNSVFDKLHHLALDCGYYDQSHFINDFNKLIGESPEKFLNGNHAYIKTYMGRRGV